VHVSQARPLFFFVLNCIGETKHVLPSPLYGCVLVNQHDGIGIFFMAQRVTYQHVRLKRLEGLTRQSRHGYGDGLQTCFEDFFLFLDILVSGEDL
jgi:hypothetical protein